MAFIKEKTMLFSFLKNIINIVQMLFEYKNVNIQLKKHLTRQEIKFISTRLLVYN